MRVFRQVVDTSSFVLARVCFHVVSHLGNCDAVDAESQVSVYVVVAEFKHVEQFFTVLATSMEIIILFKEKHKVISVLCRGEDAAYIFDFVDTGSLSIFKSVDMVESHDVNS